MNRLSTSKRAQVVMALVEGNSIRSTCRMTGVAKRTVLSLLADLGTACAAYHDENVRDVAARRIQCDEIWSFCYAKDKNVSWEQKEKGAGSLWTWTALDADSKLIVSYLCGGRDSSWAMDFMKDVASRLTTRVQITTDGHKCYVEAVEGAFGMDVDYAMLIKLYGNPHSSPTLATAPAYASELKWFTLLVILIPSMSARPTSNARTSECACRCGGLRGSQTHSQRRWRTMNTCWLSISCTTTSAVFTALCG